MIECPLVRTNTIADSLLDYFEINMLSPIRDLSRPFSSYGRCYFRNSTPQHLLLRHFVSQ